MSEITGYNPSQSGKDIRNLSETLDSIMRTFSSASTEFLSAMEENWYSPNAVVFGTKAQAIIEEFSNTFCDFHDEIIDKCQNAYNDIARSNGDPMIMFPTCARPLYYNVPYKEIDPNGIVGMNVEEVTKILDTYLDAFRTVGTSLDALPMSIAFFDPDGSLLSAYQNSVKVLEEKIEENIQLIKDTVEPYIREEQAKIKQSVSTATSQLQE